MPYFVKGSNIEIIGTAEIITGVARVTERTPPGGAIQYAGGTDVWWDTQKTKLTDSGERLWVDEDGDEFPESQIEWRDGPCEDDDDADED